SGSVAGVFESAAKGVYSSINPFVKKTEAFIASLFDRDGDVRIVNATDPAQYIAVSGGESNGSNEVVEVVEVTETVQPSVAPVQNIYVAYAPSAGVLTLEMNARLAVIKAELE